MNETRKKIIIQEIKYWKHTKLLPEQYCDYLLTLYSGGEEAITAQKSKRSLHTPLWMFTVLFFTTIFINYFTEIPIGLQITLTAIAIILFGYFMYRYVETKLLYQLSLVGVALLTLVESVNLMDYLFPNSNSALYAALFIQCGIWFIVGRKLNLLYFSISGVIGAIVMVYFILF